MPWDFLDHPVPIPTAHRGGSLEAPENTMRAFAHAVGLGYSHVELDVRATADLEVVVFHDATLERVAGTHGAVEQLRWRDMREVRVAGTESIPRLADVLDAWPDLRVTIEMKDDAAVAPVARIVADRDAWHRVCLASFSETRLARIRRLSDGRARTSLGTWGVARLRAAGSGLPVRPACDVVQVPVRWRGVPIVDRRFIDGCHAAGLQVQVWTVNERVEMERLLDLGVDGIMTDRPTLLKGLLVERGQWPAALVPARTQGRPG